jgi:putative flippase GtrA
MNKLFKENTFLGKIEGLFWKLYNKEPLRFVFWGGINTVITLLNTIVLNFLLQNEQWETKLLGRSIDIPFVICFIIGIPIAYTTHTLFTFKVKWSFTRLLRYPLSSIPNFILQSGFIYLFSEVLSLDIYFIYILSAILPLPIMFFINKFLVEPIKINKKEVAN